MRYFAQCVRTIPEMNPLPIRVKLDFTNLNVSGDYSHVWFPVKTCSFNKIADVKKSICEKYNLPLGEIQLFVNGALLRDDETVHLLRDDDSIQVVQKHNELCLTENDARCDGTKKKSRKRRRSQSDKQLNEAENVSVGGFPQSPCTSARNTVAESPVKQKKTDKCARSELDLSESHVVSSYRVNDVLPEEVENVEFENDAVLANDTKKRHKKGKKHKNKKSDNEIELLNIPTIELVANPSQPSNNKASFSQVINNAETGEPCYAIEKKEKLTPGNQVPSAVDDSDTAASTGGTGNKMATDNACSVPSKLNSTDEAEYNVNGSKDSVNLDTTNCPKKKRRRRRKRRSKTQPEVVIQEPVTKPVIGFTSSPDMESKNKHIRFEEPLHDNGDKHNEKMVSFTSPGSTPRKNKENCQLLSDVCDKTNDQVIATVTTDNLAQMLPSPKELAGIRNNTEGDAGKKNCKATNIFSWRRNFGKPYLSQTLEHLRQTLSAAPNGNHHEDRSLFSECKTSQNAEKSVNSFQKQNFEKPAESSSATNGGITKTLGDFESMVSAKQDLVNMSKNSLKEQSNTKGEHPHKDYSTYPSLNTVPPIGAHIAFKLLELSELYCPEVSDYKEGCVVGIESDDTVRIELKKEEVKRPKNGKFENVYESDLEDAETEIVRTITPRWTELIEPKLISPVCGQ